ELLRDLVDAGIHLRLVGHVHFHGERLDIELLELLDRLVGAIHVDIGDADIGPFAREVNGDLVPDAAAGARDDRNLVLQFRELTLSLRALTPFSGTRPSSFSTESSIRPGRNSCGLSGRS